MPAASHHKEPGCAHSAMHVSGCLHASSVPCKFCRLTADSGGIAVSPSSLLVLDQQTGSDCHVRCLLMGLDTRVAGCIWV